MDSFKFIKSNTVHLDRRAANCELVAFQCGYSEKRMGSSWL